MGVCLSQINFNSPNDRYLDNEWKKYVDNYHYLIDRKLLNKIWEKQKLFNKQKINKKYLLYPKYLINSDRCLGSRHFPLLSSVWIDIIRTGSGLLEFKFYKILPSRLRIENANKEIMIIVNKIIENGTIPKYVELIYDQTLTDINKLATLEIKIISIDKQKNEQIRICFTKEEIENIFKNRY